MSSTDVKHITLPNPKPVEAPKPEQAPVEHKAM